MKKLISIILISVILLGCADGITPEQKKMAKYNKGKTNSEVGR